MQMLCHTFHLLPPPWNGRREPSPKTFVPFPYLNPFRDENFSQGERESRRCKQGRNPLYVTEISTSFCDYRNDRTRGSNRVPQFFRAICPDPMILLALLLFLAVFEVETARVRWHADAVLSTRRARFQHLAWQSALKSRSIFFLVGGHLWHV